LLFSQKKAWGPADGSGQAGVQAWQLGQKGRRRG